MHLIKIAFLLSFLALCQRTQVEAAISPQLSKYLECAEVVTDCAAQLIENSVTAIKVLADCVDFRPELKLNGSIVRFIKLAYQFTVKLLTEKRSCLVGMFNTAVSLIRPSVAQFDKLQCLNT
ncbi:uncharacterized protein LOC110177425 [Drosophila serrata]|uniref:uncharacterized protein LOC110177425 n=1 Tax=Drosophila serrata TaxID=7274 RepID=UPI000A1D2AF3|nr:uncharacterized protein LOC110177425 [Drosophila serrata]